MNYADPRLRSALAAEYVLGTLDGAARRRFERLLATDAALRREVRQWEAHFYGLLELLPERTPPARVWRGVARGIAGPARPSPRQERPRLWQWWAGLATAAALVLGLYTVLELPAPPAPAPYLALIGDAGERTAWVLRADDGALRVQALQPQALEPGRSFELWLLPPAGAPPRSLGLIDAAGVTRLALSPDLMAALREAAGLAVSLEPAGGSPTGRPTGPVLYQGQAVPPA